MNAIEKHLAQIRGIVCGVCGAKDNDPDELDPTVDLLWGDYKTLPQSDDQEDEVTTIIATTGVMTMTTVTTIITTTSAMTMTTVRKKTSGTNMLMTMTMITIPSYCQTCEVGSETRALTAKHKHKRKRMFLF